MAGLMDAYSMRLRFGHCIFWVDVAANSNGSFIFYCSDFWISKVGSAKLMLSVSLNIQLKTHLFKLAFS